MTIINSIKIFYSLFFKNKGIIRIIGFFIIPIISSLINIYAQRLLAFENTNIIWCLFVKTIYSYIIFILQHDIMFRTSRDLEQILFQQLNIAKIKCGVVIPGKNLTMHKDLTTTDASKIRDFLFVIPIFWNTIISFGISIYMLNIANEISVLPIKTLFTGFCILITIILTYISDSSLYEKTKPSPTLITKFDNYNYVKMKLSMGCNLDLNFENDKRLKIQNQHNIQKYIICLINLIITYISLVSNDKAQIHSFVNISWLLGCFSDNIKSIKYYEYMEQLYNLIKAFEDNALITSNNSNKLNITKVQFVDTSFGYYSDDLTNNPTIIQKIFNFSYTFLLGKFYYLESPNGIGKSTLLNMFKYNLLSGSVYFGNINRNKLSFEDISSSIFHIVQASEYTPQFDKNEINSYKGRDSWLEERLGLAELFNKNTIEMSGGQKKRMFIYIVLTSSATVLLLDEILSELSTEETPEVPEGGGWCGRVINTLANWNGIKNKIMILVGHGLVDIIPRKNNIIKVKLVNENDETKLISR